MQCVYSVSNRIGRPRGTKNKKTLDRLNKAGESEQQNQRKAEPAEDETMQGQNDAAQEVFSSGGMHPQLSELQTQMGTNQPCGPLSAGITPDLDTLDLSLPDGDDSLLAMLDSTASWPIYNDLAGFSTSGVRLLQNMCSRVLMGKQNSASSHDFSTRSPSPTFDIAPMDLGAFSSTSSFGSPLRHITPLTSSNSASSDSSSHFLQQAKQFDSATAAPSRLMQDPTARYPTPNSKGNSTPASTGGRRSPRTVNGAACNCLERHTDLLLRLKEFQAQPNPRIDVLLVFAKRGIEAWQSLISCFHCQENDDQEVLMVTAMSIRIFVRSLRRLSLSNDHNLDHESSPSAVQNLGTSSRSNNRLQVTGNDSSGNPRGKRNSDYHCGPAVPNSQGASTYGSPANTSSAKTKLGMFEIIGNDRIVVVKVMLSRTLQQIQVVLSGLKQRATSEHRWQGSPGEQRRHYRRPMDLEQVRRLGFMGKENGGAEFAGEAEDEKVEEDDTGFVLGLLSGLEAMVLVLRRDLQTDLNPAIDSGAAAYY